MSEPCFCYLATIECEGGFFNGHRGCDNHGRGSRPVRAGARLTVPGSALVRASRSAHGWACATGNDGVPSRSDATCPTAATSKIPLNPFECELVHGRG